MVTELTPDLSSRLAVSPLWYRATTNVESIFEIPTRAFYMGNSYIQGVGTPTAGGANNYNWFHKNTHFISELYLQTRTGTVICQLPYADRYRVATRGFHVKYEEFVSADDTERFGPSRNTGLTADVGGRLTGTAVPATSPYTEIQYAERGDLNATTPAIPFTIRLSDYHDTIFALKKAMLMPEIVNLRVVWGPLNRFSWIGTDPTDPTAGAAAPPGAFTITNLYMHLAIEEDPSVLADLQKIMMAGYKMVIPAVYVNKQQYPIPTGDNGSMSLTVKITPDMGFAVKRLIYAPFANVETLNTAQDHSNVLGSKIRSYQTTLDSKPRQNWIQSCGTTDPANVVNGWGGASAKIYDDWKMHERLCRGTALLSRDIYQYNWFHCEDFSDLSVKQLRALASAETPEENIHSGMSIAGGPNGGERLWTMSATTAQVALMSYTFIVTYKRLIMKKCAKE